MRDDINVKIQVTRERKCEVMVVGGGGKAKAKELFSVQVQASQRKKINKKKVIANGHVFLFALLQKTVTS